MALQLMPVDQITFRSCFPKVLHKIETLTAVVWSDNISVGQVIEFTIKYHGW